MQAADMGTLYPGYRTEGKGGHFGCRPVTPNLLNTLILQCVKQNCSDKSHICLQQLEIKTLFSFLSGLIKQATY